MKLVRFREAQAEDRAEPEDAGGRVALVAAGLAAVERLQRAAQQEDPRASQGQPSPPKRPFKTTSVPSLCALATRSTLQLMSGGRRCRMHCLSDLFHRKCLVALFTHWCHSTPLSAPSMQYSSSLAGLTPELVELLLNHMSRERLLRPRSLELFFGCPLQKFVLNCYPYSTNEMLRQLRGFTALKHLSLINSPLITGI